MIYLDLVLIIYFLIIISYLTLVIIRYFVHFLFFHVRDNSSTIKSVSHKEILKTISQ